MLWYIDVLGYIFMKKFFIGVAAFLKWPGTPFIKKMTTSHHIWFIPLALAILKVKKKLKLIVFLHYFLQKSKNVTVLSYLCSVFTSFFLRAKPKFRSPSRAEATRSKKKTPGLQGDADGGGGWWREEVWRQG